MDQVKQILQVLKTHYFWIVCGLATLLVLGSWFSATSNLNKITQERKQAIDSAFSSAQTVAGKRPHPNEQSHQLMDEIANDLAVEVAKAWREQYSRQEQVLVWPETFTNDFRDRVSKLKPIEATVEFPTPPTQALSSDHLNQYRNYIIDELPKLAELIKASWVVDASSLPSNSAGGMFGGGMSGYSGTQDYSGMDEYAQGGLSGRRPKVDDGVVVRWNSSNQKEIAALFNFRERAPTTLEVLYAQEDLWVYEAIMRIIARVNGGAQSNFNATIKELDFVRIGRAAIGRSGKISTTRSQTGGYGDDYMMSADMSSDSYESDPSSMQGSTMPGMSSSADEYGVAAPRDPADMRYVDNNYEPLTAEKVRSAMTSGSADVAFLAVAKRMPVRIRLGKMDHRKLPQLLAACGNSSLPIEVRQVRINREAGSRGGMGGGYGSYGGFGGIGGGGDYSEESYDSMDASDMGDMMSGYGNSYSGLGGRGPRAAVKEFPHDLPVEIYGIIYIYNPVDPKTLEIDMQDLTQAQAGQAAANATAPPAPAGGAADQATPAGGGAPAATVLPAAR